MPVLHRIALPVVNSLFITAALFVFMYSLIYMKEPELSPATLLPKIAFTHIPDEQPPEFIVVRPTPPKEVEPAPEVPITNDPFQLIDDSPTAWQPYEPPTFERGSGAPTDNQLVIAIGFPPEYPSRALARGVEGFAVVGFSVSASGSVYDAYILESEPNTLFDRSSLKAINKFKYKPRKEGGRAVSTTGQRYMFTYKLDE
jgi:protein TonB